jgi:ribosomal protein S18 acetylase RimI-like enzyme
MADISIRRLQQKDADSYRALRLHGLQHEPRAFTGCYDEETKWPLAEFRKRIKNHVIAGAFVADELVGIFALHLNTPQKLRHKATFWGMYVHPDARGKGVASLLMRWLLDYAASVPDLERIVLAVTASNHVVAQWYETLGFRRYAVEPKAVKFGEDYEADEWRVLELSR